MADEPYDWLDKDAAERLLRGDPVGAPDGDGARRLQQLLDTAAAVGAGPAPSTELPGEAAAMAAFRRSQHASGIRPRRRVTADRIPTVHATRPGGTSERSRLARPFRRGFAVALAVCAIGGVAVAAGTGVLPPPFQGGGADPEPAPSVSAAETPGTLASPDPGAETDGTASRRPSGSPGPESTRPGESPSPGAPHPTRPPGTTGPGDSQGDGEQDGRRKRQPGDRKKFVLALCRAYESGKRGSMDPRTRRRLERAAGGPQKVHAFCRGYLADQTGGRSADGLLGGLTDGGQGDSGQGGDEDDDEHPAPPPSPTTPTAGGDAPASPAPSASTPAPSASTPSTAVTGGV
ncbi:hypothetical protein [Streptomyces sp. NPDC048650]|uniref:hypothetical protein n=1 Tax=unclassified Streptomyces TaxID=2593676 RepID=UPI003713214A